MPTVNEKDPYGKFAMGVVVVIVLLIIALIFLFGWGFIELIQWITTK